MGEMADLELNSCIYSDYGLDDPYIEEEEEIDIGSWETKDGRVLRITDMTLSHLENTVRFITKYRTDYTSLAKQKLMYLEIDKRKDNLFEAR